MRQVLFIAIFASLPVGSVRADLAMPGPRWPSLPKFERHVDPRLSFEGVDEYPNHRFFLRYQTFQRGPQEYSVIEVTNSRPVTLKIERYLGSVQLLAVERKAYAERRRKDLDDDWELQRITGALTANMTAPSTTAPLIGKRPVSQYRVRLEDGKLSVESTQNRKSSRAEPVGPLPAWTLAIAFSASLAWLGICFAGRGRAGTIAK
jgi:hypothetical protein